MKFARFTRFNNTSVWVNPNAVASVRLCDDGNSELHTVIEMIDGEQIFKTKETPAQVVRELERAATR